MKHVLNFNFLIIAILCFFIGTPVSAHDKIIVKDKSKNTIFGKPQPKGNGADEPGCVEAQDGEFCFSSSVFFGKLDFAMIYNARTNTYEPEAVFPCDLHAGITIEGLDNTLFTSLSSGVKYTYVEATDDFGAHYAANIDFGCIDADIISELAKNYSCGSDEYLYIPLKLEVYCKTDEGYEVFNLCDGNEDFEEYIYQNDDSETGCTIGAESHLKLCCSSSNLVSFSDSSQEIISMDIELSYQHSEISIVGAFNGQEISYDIYDMSGRRVSVGKIEASDSFNQIEMDRNLKSGIYILVLTSGNQRVSKKFATFD